MTTVYWIARDQFLEMVKQYGNRLYDILHDHFSMKGTSIEEGMLIVKNDNAVIYWLENGTSKCSTNFIKSFKYKYVEVTLSSINSIFNENRLQKQKTDVVRGNDAEGNRIQGRIGKTSITVGYLSNKAIKS
jgi:archaellum component FlaG (FlaF/FlaG flagellin family)